MYEDEMTRAHRMDYEYHDACREALRAIDKVLLNSRMARQTDARKSRLWGAQELLVNEAAHIVAVWD